MGVGGGGCGRWHFNVCLFYLCFTSLSTIFQSYHNGTFHVRQINMKCQVISSLKKKSTIKSRKSFATILLSTLSKATSYSNT